MLNCNFSLVLDNTVPDVNINDIQDKFAGYGFYRFPNLPAQLTEKLGNRTTETAKSLVYLTKTANFNPKTFVQAYF